MWVPARMMQTAQQEMTELQMYIKELWNLPIASILIDLWFTLLAAIFYTVPFTAIGAAVDNQTDSQQFCCQSLCRWVFMLVFYGYQWSPRDNCSRFLHDSAYFSYRNADANSVYVPLWQIAISVTLLFGSFFVSFGLLQSVPNWDTMYGKKPTWSEMYWLKYKAGSALLKLN
jgi:ABC-2 type transport system permease protein